jgi:hypothetical protein
MVFLSPNPTSKANQHIKSPFKHAVPKKKEFDDISNFSVIHLFNAHKDI